MHRVMYDNNNTNDHLRQINNRRGRDRISITLEDYVHNTSKVMCDKRSVTYCNVDDLI